MRPYKVIKRSVWNITFLLGSIVWDKVISFFISLHVLFITFLCAHQILATPTKPNNECAGYMKKGT